MKTEIELDHKVLQKNLELTKALQTVDRLMSENINLNAKLDEYAKEIVRLTIKLQNCDNI
jgi:predicted RNase H-like nuclease (RuvC/YqgF family)